MAIQQRLLSFQETIKLSLAQNKDKSWRKRMRRAEESKRNLAHEFCRIKHARVHQRMEQPRLDPVENFEPLPLHPADKLPVMRRVRIQQVELLRTKQRHQLLRKAARKPVNKRPKKMRLDRPQEIRPSEITNPARLQERINVEKQFLRIANVLVNLVANYDVRRIWQQGKFIPITISNHEGRIQPA